MERPTVIDDAEAVGSDCLALRVKGYDALYLTVVPNPPEEDSEGYEISREDFQKVIDIICKALGVGGFSAIDPAGSIDYSRKPC